MKNPLHKRFLRELKDEKGKYIVIFLLLTLMIGFVSGFLIADESMRKTYDESFETYNIEDGYFDVSDELSLSEIQHLEKNDISIYQNYFTEEKLTNKTTLRIFQNRTSVDRVCLMEGDFPTKKGEIAIDRMYADNNHLHVGDQIKSDGHQWKITGFVALSDYSCLFSNNNDTMFDAIKFGVAIVTPDEFASFSDRSLTYRYAWTYHTAPKNEQEEHNRSEKLMKAMAKSIVLENFVPQYQNQAITFTGDDMGSDKAMMTVLLYMIIVILAFVFAITISNTISKEANTIGTLRASGYTRKELVHHYLILPMFVTLVGALVGNILGYTIMDDICSGMYYGSYSLTTYEPLVSGEAFIKTTIIPILIMFAVNYGILSYKMTLSPLKFIRRDLSKKKQKRAFPLHVKLPFFMRFRIRIIFQNISNYIILLIGILFANMLLLFGLALPAVLNSYQKDIQSNLLSKYQYMLSAPVALSNEDSYIDQMLAMIEYSLGTRTDNESAEKFTAYSLNTTSDICDPEEILLYGIKEHSQYVQINIPKNKVYVSSGFADKYQLKKGDVITLKEKYKDTKYKFKVAGTYDYQGSLSIFMSQEMLNKTLDLDDDYFSGYFSNTKITDINEKYIGSVLDLEALTKISRQLDVSMGSMMYLVDGIAIIIFLVLIYLLSKIIIEKNAQSISMVKILGYKNSEINRLYIISTSIMVLLFLILTAGIDYFLLKIIFRVMMLSMMSGWIPLVVEPIVFIKMFFLGVITYGIVVCLEMRKIKKIPMDEALKNIE